MSQDITPSTDKEYLWQASINHTLQGCFARNVRLPYSKEEQEKAEVFYSTLLEFHNRQKKVRNPQEPFGHNCQGFERLRELVFLKELAG